jgi:hypothetical protein
MKMTWRKTRKTSRRFVFVFVIVFFFLFLQFQLDVHLLFIFRFFFLALVASRCIAVATLFVAVAVSLDDLVVCFVPTKLCASNHDRRQQFLCLFFLLTFGVVHVNNDGPAPGALAPLARRR